MCGIFGIIDNQDQFLKQKGLRTLADQMIHRGPDDEGFLLWSSNHHKVLRGDDTVDESSLVPYFPSDHIMLAADLKF